MSKFIYCVPPQASVPKTIYLNKDPVWNTLNKEQNCFLLQKRTRINDELTVALERIHRNIRCASSNAFFGLVALIGL